MRFILVRHAQSEWNQRGILQGQRESSVSARGLAQIEALLDALDGFPIEAVLSSPATRALSTAHAVAQHHAAQLRIDARLHEQHLGEFQGMMIQDMLRLHPQAGSALLAGDIDLIPAQGESARHAGERLYHALLGYAQALPGETACAITHGNTLAALLWRLHGADPAVPFSRYSPANGSFSLIDVQNGEMHVASWGHATHLLAAGCL